MESFEKSLNNSDDHWDSKCSRRYCGLSSPDVHPESTIYAFQNWVIFANCIPIILWMPPKEEILIGESEEAKMNQGNPRKNSTAVTETAFLFGTKIATKISSTDRIFCGI
jgi:hypothetical protein